MKTSPRTEFRPVEWLRQEYKLDLREKSSGDYWCRCPLPTHNDSTPSFHILEEGKWYCFGCGQGGFLVLLVASIEKVSEYEAWAYLRGLGYVETQSNGRADTALDTILKGIDRDIEKWHKRMVMAKDSLHALQKKKKAFSWSAHDRYYKEVTVCEAALEELEEQRGQLKWDFKHATAPG